MKILEKFTPILAAVAFGYALLGIGSGVYSFIRRDAIEKLENEKLEKLIIEEVNEQIGELFPKTTGPVLKKFLVKPKKNGSNS